MNFDEEIVNTYLDFQGFNDIEYEPDGNIPPDFLINKHIAIEVRRLNQHHNIKGREEALEEVKFKLIPQLNSLLNKFEGVNHDSSAFVSIRYSRPVGNIKNRIKQIEGVLIDHLNTLDQTRKYKICDEISITIFPSSTRFESPYTLGSMTDLNRGGFVVSEVYKNLQIVLQEKIDKVAPYKEKYEVWWLILVDHIGYGLNERDV
ncbi:MAG: hypothetical protein JKY85_08665, partial [Porticoccus sp.]|nr:hypothetical protein [Porticoccus sp.]